MYRCDRTTPCGRYRNDLQQSLPVSIGSATVVVCDTAGRNYVKILDPTGDQSCSRAHDRQYESTHRQLAQLLVRVTVRSTLSTVRPSQFSTPPTRALCGIWVGRAGRSNSTVWCVYLFPVDLLPLRVDPLFQISAACRVGADLVLGIRGSHHWHRTERGSNRRVERRVATRVPVAWLAVVRARSACSVDGSIFCLCSSHRVAKSTRGTLCH